MRRAIGPIVCLAIVATGCSSSSGSQTGSTTSATLTVFAASSLTAAFTQIAKDFEAAHPGVHVTFNFAGSDDLAGQIESEGGADVFASASPTWMDDVTKKGPGVTGRVDFAQNKLVVITPPDNPAGISSFTDLGKPGVQLVLAAKGVPVGDYAREALSNAGIAKAAEANVVSNEVDDASVVQKITSGEADAAIVYASDVTDQIAPEVHAVTVPEGDNVTATYPIAVVDGTEQSAVSHRFVRDVAGPTGQATLKTFGFLAPP